ncbi:protein of unknown function [Bradyrhizobium vignae]|uniref:Uncharacterized protein n=1 Tax=Bradyrhizobium vignae TaxID=1549949 RepID=A0A2U3Q356_9BRAD|nr:protein of unknown function [Bradyrhizobium vignae]
MSTSRVWISAIRCGSVACSASASSASRSRSALSTTEIRLSGPFGASCARLPMRQRGGRVTEPCSAASSPRITLNSVDLPVPLRPTRPTRDPGVICTELWSIKRRPARRMERSVIASMRPCHRKARRTQPAFSSMRLAFAPLQLVQELLKICRETRFGPEALLEPLAHGIADRAAGAPVDLYVVIGRRPSHRKVPCFQGKDTVPSHCQRNGFADRADMVHSRENCAKGVLSTQGKAPARGTPGLLLEGTWGA